MRHRVKGRTLGRSPSHRKAMLCNLITSLVEKESIITTEPRAKEARSLIEKLITLGKKGTLHHRRLAIAKLNNTQAVHKIFEDIAKRNPSRPGGYTRILKLDGGRLGDNASQVVFEFVDKAPAGQTSEEAPATENASS